MKRYEQLLAEGYQSMAELNLSISSEQYEMECEAHEWCEMKQDDGE